MKKIKRLHIYEPADTAVSPRSSRLGETFLPQNVSKGTRRDGCARKLNFYVTVSHFVFSCSYENK